MITPKPPITSALFAPASGPGVGGGHVLRCLSLREALAKRGVASVFAVAEAGADLIERFAPETAVIARDAGLTVLAEGAFDAVIIDDYALSAEQQAVFRSLARTLMVVDDLADRPHLADLLVDPGFGRRVEDYDGLLPARAVRLMGPTFAILRPQFAAHRRMALDRPTPPEPQTVFVSFGLSDVDGIAARAVTLLRAQRPQIEIDVALASDAQSAAQLRTMADQDPSLNLHFDTPYVAELMAKADMAVGAGGASTWERCCLGLPTLAVIVADNQRAMIQGMAEAGVILAADLQASDFERRFEDAVSAVCSPEIRAALRNRSAGLCDGLGVERIADALLAL